MRNSIKNIIKKPNSPNSSTFDKRSSILKSSPVKSSHKVHKTLTSWPHTLEDRKKLFDRYSHGSRRFSYQFLKNMTDSEEIFQGIGPDVLRKACKYGDQSNDGFIDRREFPTFLHHLRYFFDLFKAFQKMDQDKDNRLKMLEFIENRAILDPDLSESTAEGVFRDMDLDGGGNISFEEFCNWAIKQKTVLSYNNHEHFKVLEDNSKILMSLEDIEDEEIKKGGNEEDSETDIRDTTELKDSLMDSKGLDEDFFGNHFSEESPSMSFDQIMLLRKEVINKNKEIHLLKSQLLETPKEILDKTEDNHYKEILRNMKEELEKTQKIFEKEKGDFGRKLEEFEEKEKFWEKQRKEVEMNENQKRLEENERIWIKEGEVLKNEIERLVGLKNELEKANFSIINEKNSLSEEFELERTKTKEIHLKLTTDLEKELEVALNDIKTLESLKNDLENKSLELENTLTLAKLHLEEQLLDQKQNNEILLQEEKKQHILKLSQYEANSMDSDKTIQIYKDKVNLLEKESEILKNNLSQHSNMISQLETQIQVLEKTNEEYKLLTQSKNNQENCLLKKKDEEIEELIKGNINLERKYHELLENFTRETLDKDEINKLNANIIKNLQEEIIKSKENINQKDIEAKKLKDINEKIERKLENTNKTMEIQMETMNSRKSIEEKELKSQLLLQEAGISKRERLLYEEIKKELEEKISELIIKDAFVKELLFKLETQKKDRDIETKCEFCRIF